MTTQSNSSACTKHITLKIVFGFCVVLHYVILLPISYFGCVMLCLCWFPIPLLFPVMLCCQEWSDMGMGIVGIVVLLMVIAWLSTWYLMTYTHCDYSDIWFNKILPNKQ